MLPAAADRARGRSLWLHPLVLALLSLAVVAIAVWGFGQWLASGGVAPAAPTRHPFGAGLREAASPPGNSGIGLWLAAQQSAFYQAVMAALRKIKSGGPETGALIWLGFAYGVIHAAGPGHGKAVIEGIGLSVAAALLQACVAIGIVTIFSLILGFTARQITSIGLGIEIASFICIAALGAWLMQRKARHLSLLLAGPAGQIPADLSCQHGHMPVPAAFTTASGWPEKAGIVLAAGLRPCSGAVILLVFALTQGLFGIGILAVLAMAAGTALTTSGLAALAVYAKHAALRLASGRGRFWLIAGIGFQLLTGAFIALLGLLLALGFWERGAS
jgi:nickel/cobalt transporter (NicO) family protein